MSANSQGGDRDGTGDGEDGTAATRVVLSYPADLSKWGRDRVETRQFRAFLRRTRERAEPGTVWEEFVGVGCCGNTLDVPLRVDDVVGGDRITDDTEIDFEVRDACGIEGSWRVQSRGGPANADG